MATNQEKIQTTYWSLKPEETVQPSNEEKRAYLLQQQKNNVQPQVEQTQIDQETASSSFAVNTLPCHGQSRYQNLSIRQVLDLVVKALMNLKRMFTNLLIMLA